MLVALAAALPATAYAERTIANDTVTPETPASVSCGFCVGERFGSIFVPERTDFPFDLVDVRIAVAAARLTGSTCAASMDPGEPRASRIEIWVADAGEPTAEPSPTERLVWTFDEAPVVASASETGTADITVTLTALPIEATERIESAAYVRVLFDVPAPSVPMPGRCAAASAGEDPDAFPISDRDGITAERNVVFATSGAPGWHWSEDLGIAGDWAVRLTIQTRTLPRDAGPSDDAGRDAGERADASVDAAALDAGSSDAAMRDAALPDATMADAGRTPVLAPDAEDDGCDCRVGSTSHAGSPTRWSALLLLVAVALSLGARRRRK